MQREGSTLTGRGTALVLGGEPSGLAGGDRKAARRGDHVFRRLTTGAGLGTLVLVAAIGAFLIAKAIPALQANQANFFTTRDFQPDNPGAARFGIAAIAYGSVVTSVLSLLMAVPVSLGVALFISHYAPRRLASVLGAVIDLLAAVPSVVYGLWGLIFLVPRIRGLSLFLEDHLGFIPVFRTDGAPGKSLFTASVVLAVMVLPIITAISREVFLQTPKANEEAALALGATRWEMVRMTVLPFGRAGVVSAVLLGFGRAIGETIAVALVLSSTLVVSGHLLSAKGSTIAGNIANYYGDAGKVGVGALIASGLVLFVITLIVNFSARAITARAARRVAV